MNAATSMLDWCRQLGTELSGLEISHTDTGLGLVVTRNISAGELMLRVPHKLLLTGEQSVVTGIGETEALALALLAEKEQGATSLWAPFIQLLSSMDPVGTPLFFNASYRALLRGTDVVGLVLERESSINRTRRLLSVSATHNLSRTRLKDLTWALSIAWSRGFTISTQAATSPRPTLVPVGDLFNHVADYVRLRCRFSPCAPMMHANVISHSDPTHQAFEFFAARRMRAGEEARFSYSQHGEPSNGRVRPSHLFISACTDLAPLPVSSPPSPISHLPSPTALRSSILLSTSPSCYWTTASVWRMVRTT